MDKEETPRAIPEPDAPRSAILQLLQRVPLMIGDILGELRGDADECEYAYRSGTANTTTYDTYDLLGIISHPVKGYLIQNDGATALIFGHNITQSTIDASVLSSTARFGSLLAGERFTLIYNRKKINNIYIQASTGAPAYRLWLLW